jgi:hypothetical protein
MTDANLMDADCVHGIAWYDCKECEALTVQEKTVLFGLATTEDLMQELIARFTVASLVDDDFHSSVNYLRASTLWNILWGMDSSTRNYRTVDS